MTGSITCVHPHDASYWSNPSRSAAKNLKNMKYSLCYKALLVCWTNPMSHLSILNFSFSSYKIDCLYSFTASFFWPACEEGQDQTEHTQTNQIKWSIHYSVSCFGMEKQMVYSMSWLAARIHWRHRPPIDIRSYLLCTVVFFLNWYL